MSEKLMTLEQAKNDPAAQAALRHMSKGMFPSATSRDNKARRSHTHHTDTPQQVFQPETK